ncbi:zinc finger protein 423-like isoform X2 [Amphiura filiformis]|uniref:zinc finger protein 423-like isoform X2 n=1 Tax=Amphiura filiformis TaxID=82378 RepID=UPI003B2176A3
MSRRKQSKPRAVKRDSSLDGTESMEEDIKPAFIDGIPATKLLHLDIMDANQNKGIATLLTSPTSDTSSCTDQRSTHSKHSSLHPTNENSNCLSDVDAKDVGDDLVAMETDDAGIVGGDEGGVVMKDEEEGEIYKCDNCEASFTSIGEFMDHRNFDLNKDSCEGDTGKDSSEKLSCSDDDISCSDQLPLGEIDGDPDSPFMLEHKGIVGNINGSLPYPCQFCDKSFSRLSYLKRHEQVHSDKMPFKCTFCSRLFKHKRSRDRHIKLHTGDKKYRCVHCDSSFSRSDHLKIHLKTHNVSKPYPCTICNRGYTTSTALASHVQNCHKGAPPVVVKEFKCVQCSQMFATSQALQDHLTTHGTSKAKGPKATSCIYCSESFSNKQALGVHLEVAHIANKKLKCSVCYESFLSDDLLQSHMEKHCEAPNEPQTFNCPYCPKITYPSLAVLNIHLSTMHGDKPLQMHSCNQCGKEYPSLFNLSEHISAMHEQDSQDSPISPDGTSTYTCGYCTVQFSSTALLHSHVKSVHSVPNMISCDEDGNLRCPKCSLGFAGETALEDHLRNVHGVTEMPTFPSSLHCPHCGKAFPNHTLLQEHVQRSHKKPLDKMKYPCPYCIKQNLFDSIEQLQLHVEVYHKSDRAPVYLCPEGDCKAHFNSAEDLSSHLQEDHHQGGPAANKMPTTSSTASTNTLNVPSYTKANNEIKKERQTKSPLNLQKQTPPLTDGKMTPPENDESPTDRKYGCPSCHNEFSNEDQLVVHVLTHYKTMSAEFVCKDCGKSFKKPDELQKHLFEIHAHHLYKCSLCKEVFDSKVSIQVHFAVKHSNECKLFSCIKCGVVYRTEGDLLIHVKFEHLKIPQPFKCIFCCQSFSSDVEFQCHLTSHSEQYRCPFCNAPYASQESLEVHLHATHDYPSGIGPPVQPDKTKPVNGNETDKKTKGSKSAVVQESKVGVYNASKEEEGCFVCKICDQKFPLKILLEKHHLREHDIKARSATIKSEMTSSSVSPPMDLSNGSKSAKYGCDICTEQFQSKYELLKHVNSHSVLERVKSPRASPTGSVSPKPGSPTSWPCMCYVCKQPIRIETEFLSHAQQHNNEISGPGNTIRCIACLQLLNSMVELQLHARYHTQAPPITGVQELYPCYVCGKTFGSRTDVVPKLDGSGRPCFMCISCIKTSLESQFRGGQNTGVSTMQFPVDNGIYRCPTCSVKFESYEELEAHLPTHGNNKTYQCIKCQQNFATEAEIQLHVTSHVIAEGIHLECKLCNQVFDSPAKLQCHLVDHTFPDKDYRCPVCHAMFSCPIDIQAHAIEHGIESRRHKCTQCSQTFFFTAELQNHVLSHPSAEDISQFHCPECPRSFNSASNLNNHVRIHDTKEKTFKCSLCPEIFFSTADMQQHFFQMHNESEFGTQKKSFKCGQCSQSFPCLSNLQGHMRIHSDGKKFTCTDCGKVFALARNLTIHMRSHSGEKPYQCPVCDKRFARKENRKVHLKSHSGVKPFMCPHCAKMFSRKCHVREHMRTHSNTTTRVANYQCEICNETFTLSKNLRRHMRRMHIKMDEIAPAGQSQSSSSTSPDSIDGQSPSMEEMYADLDDPLEDSEENMCTEAIVSSSQDPNDAQDLSQPEKAQSE